MQVIRDPLIQNRITGLVQNWSFHVDHWKRSKAKLCVISLNIFSLDQTESETQAKRAVRKRRMAKDILLLADLKGPASDSRTDSFPGSFFLDLCSCQGHRKTKNEESMVFYTRAISEASKTFGSRD